MQINTPTKALLTAMAMAVAGCGTIQTRNTVVIEQPKPLEVNVNLTGRLELVITDARKDLESITGQKAKREVRPEDIGLPPDSTGATAPLAGLPATLTLGDFSGPSAHAGARATEDELVASMAARNTKVRQILSALIAGEAHTGLLVTRGAPSGDQSATIAAENADRSELYKLRAAKSGTTVAQAALAYYLQRLGYAQKGDWVEKYNKSTQQWEWVQWAG